MGMNPAQAANVANAVATGTKNASAIALANQQGQNASAFDVFTHTGHGLADSRIFVKVFRARSPGKCGDDAGRVGKQQC